MSYQNKLIAEGVRSNNVNYKGDPYFDKTFRLRAELETGTVILKIIQSINQVSFSCLIARLSPLFA